MMKRIGIDLRCLPMDGSVGAGIAHAARAVTTALIDHRGDREILLFVPKGASVFDERMGRIPSGVTVASLTSARRVSLIRALGEHSCDVLFVPSGAVPLFCSIPAIPWVHDIDIFFHPEWFPQPWVKRQITTKMVQRGITHAPRIAAVSEYTKWSLIERFHLHESRIVVTGEGGDEALVRMRGDVRARDNARKRLRFVGIDDPFVLLLGTVEPRKNIPFITQLWPEVVHAIPGRVDLVIAGRDGWNVQEIDQEIRLCGERCNGHSMIMRLKDFDDGMKRDLLTAAEMVFVPSFSEGFGLVALEAMQAGTPVLTSNRGALSEIVGTKYALPLEQKRWIDAIQTGIGSNIGREAHVREQVISERYTWSAVATRIYEAISEIE